VFRRRLSRFSRDQTLAKKKKQLYSRGQLNLLVDALVHPHTKNHPEVWGLDTVLHGLVERDPELTLQKFIRYTVPKILRDATRNKK
jgi:hypothetical protein